MWADDRTTPDNYWPFATEGSGTDVYAARIDAAGNVIDANPILIKLPRNWGELMIPTWIQIMPDGELLEDNGVPPDVRLPDDRAFSAAIAYVKDQLR